LDFEDFSLNNLEELVSNKQFTQLKKYFEEMLAADIAELIDAVPVRDALLIYRLVPKIKAVEVFPLIQVERQSELMSLVSEDELKIIINELYFDDMIDLIEEVPANMVKKILKNSTQQERKLINQFLNYPEDSAGSLMTIEFVELKKEMTVAQAIQKIRLTGVDKETIYTCYVVDKSKFLEGIVSLKKLVLSDSDQLVSEIMTDEFVSVQTQDDQEIIADV